MAGTQAVFITADAANQVLRDMVQAQIAAFGMQQRGIEDMNAETRSLIDKTRDDVNRSLLVNKAAAEAYVAEQVGALRAQTDNAVTTVDGKLQEIRDLLLSHDDSQAKSVEESKLLHSQLDVAKGEQESIQQTQQQANRHQQAIQALIDSTTSEGNSSVLRPGSDQERTARCYPFDYKIDGLSCQLQVGIWKKWRLTVEIYIDTIAPLVVELSYFCNRRATRLPRLNPVARR